jgi:hypothetical protein
MDSYTFYNTPLIATHQILNISAMYKLDKEFGMSIIRESIVKWAGREE